MLRRSSLLLVLALSACRSSSVDASVNAEPGHLRATEQPATSDADVDQPGHLLLPWGTVLYAAPSEDAIALRLATAEDPEARGPAVAVVGREGA